MGVGDDVAPRFTQKPALRQEDGGQRLVFQCVLEASPKPEISWFRGTTPLTSSDRLRMRVDSAGGNAYDVIMEILGVTQNDAGTYKVTAKNRLGEVSASINLNFSGQYPAYLAALYTCPTSCPSRTCYGGVAAVGVAPLVTKCSATHLVC